MESSQSIKELTIALNKVQGQLQPAQKNAENPYFKSKYADLVEVWSNCRKLLHENGLAVIQIVNSDNGIDTLETTLAHISGEWVRGKMAIHAIKNDPQGIGSAISYARRYALAAVIGITTVGEDDDAESAMDEHKKVVSQRKEKGQGGQPAPSAPYQNGKPTITNPNAPASDNQLTAIFSLERQLKITDELAKHEYVARLLGLPTIPTSLKTLTKVQASQVIEQLQKQLEERK